MKKVLKLLIRNLIALYFLSSIIVNICVASNRILAKVGEDIITSNNLEKRYIALIKTNNLSPAPEEVKTLRLQLLHSLINEKIIMQEGRRLKIKISDQDITETIDDTERIQNLPKGSFIKHHEQYGITKDDIWEQMRIKLTWQKILVRVIFSTYGYATISDTELNEFIIQNHSEAIKIKGFLYELDKKNIKILNKLNKMDKEKLCNVAFLKRETGLIPKKINSTLTNIKSLKIRQIASFAKETPTIVTAEKNAQKIVLILCSKKPTINEKELDRIKLELKDKKIALYTEYYLKTLKKKIAIKINDMQ